MREVGVREESYIPEPGEWKRCGGDSKRRTLGRSANLRLEGEVRTLVW